MELSFVLLSIIMPLILVAIIFIAISWKVIDSNKQLKKQLKKTQKENTYYQREFAKLKKSKEKPENKIVLLNKIVRGFFNEYYNLSPSLTYSEIAKIFDSQNKKESYEFCNLMELYNYSGEKIKLSELRKLMNLFEKILKNKNQINNS